MIGKSSLPVTGLPAERRTVPSGTINVGALDGAGTRFATLIGCGVPSMSSGGIEVVSATPAPEEELDDPASSEEEAPFSPQPAKIRAQIGKVSNANFFMILSV